MNWECLKCGKRNDDEDYECAKCHLDRYSAMNMIIQRRKRMCEECGHMHRQGLYCHVYTETADDVDDDEEEEEEEASALTDSDSDSDILGTGKVKEAEEMKLRPLKTPAFVKAIRYVRCNCDVGVPNDSKRFEPMPAVVQVGRIFVETYVEIMDPQERARFLKSSADRYAETKQAARVKQRNVDISYCLPHILSYLPLGQCNQAPMVNTYWNYGTNLYTLYIDVRNCIPWQTFRIHSSQVDSVCIANGKLYTGGDKRVICSNYKTGEVFSTITRDSGDICCLFEHDAELFCCSTNGSIRTYYLTHTGKNIKPHVTMWEHTRAITQLMAGLPSEGVCTMHGISNHVCDMYTASEDRSIKHWNITKYKALRSISSKTFRSASITKLAQSPRHLFCGTTNASIGVFCKSPYCERTDVHSCSIANADKHYCLQLTLRLPYVTMESGSPTTVTGLICTGPNYAFTHLWASDSTGQLTIWYVPEYGLEFIPAYTVSAHKRTINNLVCTYRHAITISDDGFLKMFDLASYALIRQVDVLDWCIYKELMPVTTRTDIPRRLKCIHLKEDSANGGIMVVGTNYGDVMVFSLGTTV